MAGFRLIFFVLVILPGGLFAQANRYVVHFKDKVNTPYSVSQPGQFLSARSLDRRSRQQIAVTEDDLPVDPDYVHQVRSTGARTFFTSRWMNSVLVEIGADSIGLLQSLPFVSSVELAAPGQKLMGGRIKKFRKLNVAAGSSSTAVQLKQLGIDQMQSEGYHGENIMLAVLDAGFPGVNTIQPFHRLFLNNQITYTFDFVANSGNVYQYDKHGTEVLSVIAGDIPGSFSGGAPAASFCLFVTEDVSTEYRIEEYNWLFAAERADSAGADIITTSLGYNQFDDSSMDYLVSDLDGKTAVITRAASAAIARGIVVVCSAGNEGTNSWHYITAPSDAQGILATGAVTLDGLRASFSSVGPTADSRIKPDVMAMGVATAIINPAGVVGSGSGTSFASPLIAALAAGILQAFPNLTQAEVYNAFIRSGDQAFHPDNLRGYGVPNYVAVRHLLESQEIQDPVMIYPNPVTADTLQVIFKEPTGEMLTITVYDQLGRMLSSSSVVVSWQNNPLTINMEGLSPGLYLIKVKGPSIMKSFRWVKL